MVKKAHNSKRPTKTTISIFSLLGSELGWPIGIKPSGNKIADAMALKLITDSQDQVQNYRSLTKWCIDNQLHPRELTNYRERFQCVELAAQYALAIFGERREERIGSGQDKDSLSWVLPQYNETWQKERDRRAELKQKVEESKGNTFNIHMPATPELAKEAK